MKFKQKDIEDIIFGTDIENFKLIYNNIIDTSR